MFPPLRYCPNCDQHVEMATAGAERPYCPLCEELLPQEVEELQRWAAALTGRDETPARRTDHRLRR